MRLSNYIRYIYYFNYYRKFKSCGSNVLLSRGGLVIRPEEIEIGNNVFISSGFRISARNLIIGNNIMIGPNLIIECEDHKYDKIGQDMFSYRNDKVSGKTIIEDDIWIGANVTILKNIVIGEGAVIGACSLVKQNIHPYTINAGIPSKQIKLRFSLDALKSHLILVQSKYNYDYLVDLYKKEGIL